MRWTAAAQAKSRGLVLEVSAGRERVAATHLEAAPMIPGFRWRVTTSGDCKRRRMRGIADRTHAHPTQGEAFQ
jgi:hypothetical protein